MQEELEPGEWHPAARNAWEWLADHKYEELMTWLESFSSVALSGNRLAGICAETLRRYLDGEPVSDRYLLGLTWMMSRTERKPKEAA